MPIEYVVSQYGDTISLKRVHAEEGVIAILYRNIPAEAKAALVFMAEMATALHSQLDAEIAAHQATSQQVLAVISRRLDKAIQLLEVNQQLQEQIAELRELRGHFPLIAKEQ